jgi:heat shock protein HtpX
MPFPASEPVLVYDRIESNWRWTFLLLFLFGLVALPALAFLTQHFAETALSWLRVYYPRAAEQGYGHYVVACIATAASLILIVYLQYRLASSIVLWLSGARTLDETQAPEFSRSVENLCIGAGLPKPQIRIVESTATNAFSTGLDPQNSFLVVTRGLLRLLDKSEWEGIIAQELSQIGNYDTRLKTVMAAVVATLWLPLLILKCFIGHLFRTNSLIGAGCLTLLATLAILLFFMMAASVHGVLCGPDPLGSALYLKAMMPPIHAFFVAPVLGLVILNAMSREREYLADADAVLLTRDPSGLARALTKMGVGDNARMKINPATAHLYILDPRRRRSLLDHLLASHPPVEKRVEILAGMSPEITQEMLKNAEEAGKQFNLSDRVFSVENKTTTIPRTSPPADGRSLPP